ncbi:galactoside 2-alpha-L-fucosyltransferase [Ditylenchus destructor]|uniref:Galactoside 2-alpha-L-fucosyltransferase n=1 Tax=Ditylenchus destructor TaxID=166010 RepID=A0AAD4QX71_9BILA|nr:galactoside 2-alpha-L-fucosyltransferase [Ditylenchus destructor]
MPFPFSSNMEDIKRFWYTKFKLPANARQLKIGLVLTLTTATLFICCWWISMYSGAQMCTQILSTLVVPKKDDLQNASIPEYDKYVGSMVMACGGLGNMMWRFASLYGIGRQLKRTPYIEESWQCMKDSHAEALEIFPEYGKRMRFVATNSTNLSKINFGSQGCCKYDNVDRLKNETNEYILLNSDYFQDYRYFNAVRNEIRFPFQWSKPVLSKVEKYGRFLFGPDSSHKLCVHTRMGDFVNFQISSKPNFTESALDFAYKNLLAQFGNVSVVLLGEDKEFLLSIKYDETLNSQMYIPHKMSRGEDMAFATLYCDSLLITAQASTFSWWIGYLMRANWDPQVGRIFFNSDFKGNSPGGTYSMDNFPPHWIPLRLTMIPRIEVENTTRSRVD